MPSIWASAQWAERNGAIVRPAHRRNTARGNSLLISLEFPACPHLPPPPLSLCWGLWRATLLPSLKGAHFCLGNNEGGQDRGGWRRCGHSEKRDLEDFLEEEALELRS